jgi:hypothetical protein
VKCFRGIAMGNTPYACASIVCCVDRLKSQPIADTTVMQKKGWATKGVGAVSASAAGHSWSS